MSSPTPSMVPIPLFESTPAGTASAPSLPNSDIPHKYIIVLITLIPTAIILAVILGVVHCLRKRNKRIIAAKSKDIEMVPYTRTPARPVRQAEKAMPALPQKHANVRDVWMRRSSPLANDGFSADESRPVSAFHQGKGKGPARPATVYIRP